MLSSFYTPSGYPAFLYQLANGHRVLIEQRPTDFMILRTFIKTGSNWENPVINSPHYQPTGFPSGIAHLDEHCHFLTTQHFPQKNTWVGAIQQMGAMINATTSHDFVQHEVTFSRDKAPQIIAMHGEAVLKPRYSDSELIQEKRNVINEGLERTTPPDYKVANKTWELMFDRPIVQTLGKQSDVMRTSAQHLQQFFDTFYRPDNMLTIVSGGSADPAALLPYLDQAFGDNPPRMTPMPQAAIKNTLGPNEKRVATLTDPKLTYSIVNLGFPAPEKTNLRERTAMMLLGMVLGEGDTALLPSMMVDHLKLATKVQHHYQAFETAGLIEFSLHTRPGAEHQTAATTLELLNRFTQQPLDPSVVSNAKSRMIHDYKRLLNDTDACTMLLGHEALSNSMPYFTDFIRLTQSITPEELMMTARKYLNPNRYTLVYGVPGRHTTPTGIEDLSPETGGKR
jgi:zinc protease